MPGASGGLIRASLIAQITAAPATADAEATIHSKYDIVVQGADDGSGASVNGVYELVPVGGGAGADGDDGLRGGRRMYHLYASPLHHDGPTPDVRLRMSTFY